MIIIKRLLAICLCCLPLLYSAEPNDKPTVLLIRADDLGMSHAVNMAAKELVDAGLIFSASVMTPCPWYQEAIEILKENPAITPGIHLTLNSEWQHYKWGPVAGAGTVPSLVDENGYFFPTRDLFYSNNPKLHEIELELRAQIERAMRTGVEFKYIDFHMGAARSRPEYLEICERLGSEYGLALSGFMGETFAPGIYAVSVDMKQDSLISMIRHLEPGGVYVLVSHISTASPEMAALRDLNSFGLQEMSRHRETELRSLTSPEFLQALREMNIRLMNYREYIETRTK